MSISLVIIKILSATLMIFPIVDKFVNSMQILDKSSLSLRNRRYYGNSGVMTDLDLREITVYLSSNGIVFCKGIIIHNNWILSSASCIYTHLFTFSKRKSGQNQIIEVKYVQHRFYGNEETEKFANVQRKVDMSKVHFPNDYRKEIAGNDLALIEVEESMRQNYSMKFGSMKWPDEGIKTGCVATGYDQSNTFIVHQNKKGCPCIHSNSQLEKLVCTTNLNGALNMNCDNDYGRALFCDGRLIGIFHGRINKNKCEYFSTECHNEQTVDVYTYVCPYLSWISTIIPTVPNRSVEQCTSRAVRGICVSSCLITLISLHFFTILCNILK